MFVAEIQQYVFLSLPLAVCYLTANSAVACCITAVDVGPFVFLWSTHVSSAARHVAVLRLSPGCVTNTLQGKHYAEVAPSLLLEIQDV
jgi:hypothetical protein